MKNFIFICLFITFIAPFSVLAQEATLKPTNWHLHSPKFKDQVPKTWQAHNTLKLGGVITAGNSENITLDASESLTLRKGLFTDKLNAGAVFSRSQVNGASQTTAQYFFANNQTEYLFYKKWYWQTGLGWLTDQLNGLDHKIQAMTGIGNYFIETDSIVFKAGGGYTYDKEFRIAPDNDQSIHSATLGYLFSWQINEHVSLRHISEGFFNLEVVEDVRFNTLAEIKANLIEHLSLALTSNFRFDNQPVTGFKKWDFAQTASVVLDF
ncbi:MAG: DUF481 domain-containing protein [Deltaproteobacteria bacterium]|nr:DUF481 domain-containing protein [Deltaproteobacteria bacterium]